MFKMNLLLAFRSLMKEKGFAIINTLGLAIGLSFFLLIMVYVIHENSYEKYIPEHEQIYRLYQHGGFNSNSEETNNGFHPTPMSAYLLQNYPEVEKVATVGNTGGMIISYGDKSFQDWRGLIADTTFVDMFPTEFIQGDPKTALQGKNKVVLTQESVQKWFAGEDPMGKLIKVGNRDDKFEVTGVVANPRTDTHIKYTMLLSEASFSAGIQDTWINSRNSRFVYLKLKTGVSIPDLEKKIQTILYDKIEPEIIQITSKTLADIVGNGEVPTYHLQPIREAYIENILNMDIGGIAGNKTLVSIALIIAFAILLLACINFINLSTARFANRMKEISVKKTAGAQKKNLFSQFFSEAYIITFIAIIIALAITELSMKAFCDMLMLEYVISVYKLPYFFPFIILVFLLVGFLSGLYPALIMSNVNIIEGLRNKKNSGSKGNILRKVLVIFQFGISLTILLGAIVISSQISYMLNDDKGFSVKNTIVLHNIPDIQKGKVKTLKQEILAIDGVKNASLVNIYPTAYPNTTSIWKEDDTTKNSVEYIANSADADFIETLQVSIIEGSNFTSKERDTVSVLINETAKNLLGYENPIGKRLVTHSGNVEAPERFFTIIGVVKDYNIEPVHNQIKPLFITTAFPRYQNMIVKIDPNNKKEIMAQIQSLWKDFSNGNSLSYEEMDDVLNWLYRNEISANTIINVFSVVCILIACLGLLGLVSYSTLRKTKEIGIRKANGAEIWQILVVLSKDTVILLALAVAIFTPIAYYIISQWLSLFAYHISISFSMIIVSIISLYVIALLCEIALTYKAAKQNPIKSLRYE